MCEYKELCYIVKSKNATNLKIPYFILAMFRTCFFSPFSNFNDKNIKIRASQ